MDSWKLPGYGLRFVGGAVIDHDNLIQQRMSNHRG
jgi:hypothetical protein